MKDFDLIVIGAGAAGLTAAVSFMKSCISGRGGSVLLIDANDEPGKKILATGNGRCNLSNTSADGWERTKEFFESLGLMLYTDAEGRVYPMSRQASSVRDALVREASALGAELVTGMRVTDVRRGGGGGFIVSAVRNGGAGVLPKSARRERATGVLTQREAPCLFAAKQLIVATGGKACPKYGNFGDGYSIARSFGLGVNPIRPALVPFMYSDEVKKELSAIAGVRARAKVELLMVSGADSAASAVASSEGEVQFADYAKASSEGEVQFADYGLSGICIFDLSRYYRAGAGVNDVGLADDSEDSEYSEGKAERHGYAVRIDLAPGHSEDGIAGLLADGRAAGLSGVVNSKIAEYIAKHGGGAEMIKRFTVPVKGTKGWKEAQITAGGVSMDEVDPNCYESRAVPGLYFAGEVLDYDGPSGGYNLNFAWNTGQAAGSAAGSK